MTITYNFEGKVVLVTGSSSGIGAATAVRFAKSGANVVVTGRNAEKIKAVANKCRESSLKKLKPLEVTADLTNEEDAKRLIDTTVKTFGKLDILVNNAGATTPVNISDPEYMNKFRTIQDTNLNSVVYLTHLAVPHLEKSKGNIVNVSSIGSLRANPYCPPYNTAKAGLDMFSRAMSAELGPKRIRCNIVNPGVVQTNMANAAGLDMKLLTEAMTKYSTSLPVGRIGQSDDIANAILFFASEDSAYITGANLVADGGHCARNVASVLDIIADLSAAKK